MKPIPLASIVLLHYAAVPPLAAQTVCGPAMPVAIPIPKPPPGRSLVRARFGGVDALKPGDAWTVGSYSVSSTSRSNEFTLTSHWDGRTWSVVPSPSPSFAPGITRTNLYDVAMVATNDAWAVGTQHVRIGWKTGLHDLILRWNGSRWSVVPSPRTGGGLLYAVEAISASDVWLAGLWSAGTTASILHWNGSGLRVHRVPTIGNPKSHELLDVSASGPKDVWAVGCSGGVRTGGSPPYVVRWNGSSWSLVNVPHPAGHYHDMYAVEAIAPGDVWIAGIGGPATAKAPFVAHWDGRGWKRFPMSRSVHDFHAFGSSDVYAVGGVVQHWNGTSWRIVDTLGFHRMPFLRSVAASGPCDLWAVGTQWSGSPTAVMPLSVHVGSSGRATPRQPCSARKLPWSLLPSTAPVIGKPLLVGMDDPLRATGVSPGSTVTLWWIAARADRSFPCGTVLPGFGAKGGVGELLIDITGPRLQTGPVGWTGSGPAYHRIDLPPLRSLFGLTLHTQGAFFDRQPRIVLSQGLDLRIGR